MGSEAARTGWLGDVDFTADLQGIMDNFRQAHVLRKVAYALSMLESPGADDRRILADAVIAARRILTGSRCNREK
jgi:hypothetical protein